MTDTLTPVLTAYWDQPDIFTLDGYRRAGGWQALPKALGMTPDEVIVAARTATKSTVPGYARWDFRRSGKSACRDLRA